MSATKKNMIDYVHEVTGVAPLGVALPGSKPIPGTDRHEVDVLIGGVGAERKDKPRAELGTIWRRSSKAWRVKSWQIDGAHRWAGLVEMGGTQNVTMLTTYDSIPLDETWVLFAADMAAFEKLRDESEAALRAKPPGFKMTAVDGRRVPKPGDTWRLSRYVSGVEAGEHTIRAKLCTFGSGRTRWQTETGRYFDSEDDGTLSDAWTFVRSAKEKPCFRCLWPADKCTCNENAMALAGGAYTNAPPAKAYTLADVEAAAREMLRIKAPLRPIVDFGCDISSLSVSWHFPNLKALAAGFDQVVIAMWTPEGQKICKENAKRDLLAARPRALEKAGWPAACAAYLEGKVVGLDVPAMVGCLCRLLGEDSKERRQYERALETPVKLDNVWRWRKGARQ